MKQSDSFPEKIKIVEVGPRDGLQNIAKVVAPAERAVLIDKLVKAGLKHIEAGSFVSTKAIPQMANSAEVFHQLKPVADVVYSALTPNLRGFEEALAAGATEVAVFVSASEGFSHKNINCGIAQSFKRLQPVVETALNNNIRVRGYVSCVMGCPYDGVVGTEQVAVVCRDLVAMGCYEVSLGDTIGVGTPLQAKRLVDALKKDVPEKSMAAHFHNTYGQALVNLYAVVEEGITVVDTSIGGLGGCPYAPEAAGNVATEDVVYMLDGMGIETGIDRNKLMVARTFVNGLLSHE